MRIFSFSRKQWIKAGLFLLLYLVSLIIFVFINLRWVLGEEKKPNGYFYTVILIFGFLFYPLSTYLSEKIDAKYFRPLRTKYLNGKKGDEGETIVHNWLKDIPEAGEIFRNVEIPGNNYDIDCVLLNAKGLILIEIKNLTDKILFSDDGGIFQIKNGRNIPLTYTKDPRIKLAQYASDLRLFLFAHEIHDIKQFRILAFPNNNVEWEKTPGTYIIKTKEDLKKYINGLQDDPNCTLEKREKIKKLLKPLSI